MFLYLGYSIFGYKVSLYTLYYSYISALNYLDTNLIFIFCFFCLFFFINQKWLFILFLKFTYSASTFTELFFFKTLLPTLVIGTVLIHPIMFYLFLTILLIKLYSIKKFSILHSSGMSNHTIVLLLFITLILGGLWSTQSNAWGYFWVNDLIEWVLLSFILLLVISFHFWFLIKLPYNFFLPQLILISLLILIRIGFFSTRHNFFVFSVSMYVVIYIYVLILYFLSKTTLRIAYYSNYIIFISINLWLVYGYPILLIKFYFTLYCILLLSKKLISLTKLTYFHYFFMFFFLTWLSYFTFFSAIAINSDFIDWRSGINFTNIFLNNSILFYKNLSFEALTAINFFTSMYKYQIFEFFKVKLLLLLNNAQLSYLLFIYFYFYRKTGWI